MIRLVLAALRSRRAQTLTVLVLALVAVAGAVGAPWYVVAAARSVAAADVAAAPPDERSISVWQEARLTDTDDPRGVLEDFRSAVQRVVSPPGGRPVLTMSQRADASLPIQVAYREGVCAHLRLNGACPAGSGEVAVSRRTADAAGVGVGGVLTVRPRQASGDMAMRVVGVYDLVDAHEDYWAGSPLVNVPTGADGSPNGDPVFTVPETFAGRPGLAAPTLRYDVGLPDAVLATGAADLPARLAQMQYALRQDRLTLESTVPVLAGQIRRDRDAIQVGVVAGAAQLLALCWFALYLAGRYTARDRRADVALLKLRGVGRLGMLRLIVGQAAVPVLAAVVPGAVLGYLAARWLAGPASSVRLAAQLSAAAVGVAVFGALLALVLAELGTLRAPVVALLRRVPPRRRAVRLDAVRLTELIVVVLAVAGVYQARAQGGRAAPGLALLAPGLVALAFALLLARLAGHLAGRVGAWAVRSGRVRTALGALQVARRPGTDRVLALLVIAVALLGTAANARASGDAARGLRAGVDLGAPRVLSVRAQNPAHLLSAVRRADPDGRFAMAVVVNPRGSQSSPPTLAVDSARLGSVALWRNEYGSLPGIVAALRPAAPPDLPVTGSGLTVDASADASNLLVSATVENRGTGTLTRLAFGPLTRDRATYRAAVAGCASGTGCRLVSLQVSGPLEAADNLGAPPQGGTVTVYAVGQSGPDRPVASGAVLGDVRRWRPVVASAGMGLTIAARADTLVLTVSTAPIPEHQRSDLRAFVADSALPVPAVLAGKPPVAWLSGQSVMSPFGGSTVPVRVAATAPVLPVLGGSGVLVDLESAVRGAGTGGADGTAQVWLGAAAPPSIVDRLRAAGLMVLGEDSVTGRQDRLDRQSTAATQRFQLLTAALGLLLAAAAVWVAAAVERGPRAGELVDLRAQGLPGRVARDVGYGGYAALVGFGVLAGLLGTVLAHWLADVRLPVFADSWATLPPPTGLRPGALLLTGAVALGVLGVAGWAAAVALVRRVRAS